MEVGFSASEAADLIWKAVELANEAREVAREKRRKRFTDTGLLTIGEVLTSLSSYSEQCEDNVFPADNHLSVLRSCGPYGGKTTELQIVADYLVDE